MSQNNRQHIFILIGWTLTVMGIGIASVAIVSQLLSQAKLAIKELQTPRLGGDEIYDRDAYLTQDTKRFYTVGSPSLENIQASAYLVADLETGQVLLEKRSRNQLPIASITKLMTAVIAKENLITSNETKVSQQALSAEGWRGNLSAGEKITLERLLYPLLLTSSNDASEVIAESSSRDAFIATMNAKAKRLGMFHTTFDDPSGLSAQNTSSSQDLFLLTKYIYQEHPELYKITRSSGFSDSENSWRNITRLRIQPTFYGGKTGYTSKAKQTSTGVYQIPLSGGEVRPLIIVILGSDSRESDVSRLITYVQKYIHYGDETSLDNL